MPSGSYVEIYSSTMMRGQTWLKTWLAASGVGAILDCQPAPSHWDFTYVNFYEEAVKEEEDVERQERWEKRRWQGRNVSENEDVTRLKEVSGVVTYVVTYTTPP